MATDRGTALTEGQLAEFVGAGTKALILISSRLGPALAHNWANNGKAMEHTFLLALMPEESEIKPARRPPQPLVYPADGVEFELTLAGDAIDPLAMVKADGYDLKGWQFNGKRVSGTQTRRFKWVAVGYQPNLEAVRTECAKHGMIPEGQWREAVKQMFQPDGQHPRGIADSSWVDSIGSALFPYVRPGGGSGFCWAVSGQGEHWRWLVGVSPSTKA